MQTSLNVCSWFKSTGSYDLSNWLKCAGLVLFFLPLVFSLASCGGIASDDPCSETVPNITALSPTSVPVHSNTFKLQVIGSGFNKNSRVAWNGRLLDTKFTSENLVVADVPLTYLTQVGPVDIQVSNYSDCSLDGYVQPISNIMKFNITLF